MRSARDILRRDDGITIVFAVLLVILLLVMGGVIVSSAYSGYKRSVSDNADERNYQNVASAVKLVRDELLDEQRAQGPEGGAARGWAADLLRAAQDGTGDEKHPAQLEVEPKPSASASQSSSSASSKASFADVSIAVRKVSDGSYDMVCFETGNPTGTALQVRVGYSSAGRITSIGGGTGQITKVGQ